MSVTRADGGDFDAKNAGVDLTGNLYHFAKIVNGDLVLAGANEDVYGVITEEAVLAAPATVQVSGLTKAVAAGAIAAGARVKSNVNGQAVTMSGATAMSFGIARNAVAAAGELVEIQIDRSRGA